MDKKIPNWSADGSSATPQSGVKTLRFALKFDSIEAY